MRVAGMVVVGALGLVLSQNSNLIAPNAPAAQMGGVISVPAGMRFPEGPLWMGDRLIASDVAGNAVWEFKDGAARKLTDVNGGPNGQAFMPDGTVVRAVHRGQIVRYDKDGVKELEVMAGSYEGKIFNSPNDLVVRSDGSIYFTDPTWGLGGRESALGYKGIFRVGPDKKVTLLHKDLFPNGIAFSPDERVLYVSDNTQRVYAFDVSADGTALSNRRDFAPGNDGIKVDKDGNVWSTLWSPPYGVNDNGTVFITSPAGREIGKFTTDGQPTNLTWGGRDGKTLFVTTTKGVFSYPTNTTRAPVPGPKF